MFEKKVANEILTRLDHNAELISANAAKWGIPEKVANAIIRDLDLIADNVEVQAFGRESLATRQKVVLAKVIQKESDEPYMNAFENPMAPLLTNSDEPYMQAYADDQSSAVRDGKSSTGLPLAPLEGILL